MNLHPPLRFKQQDGTDFPDWDALTLGDIGRVATCGRVYKNQTAPTGEVPFFKISTFGGEPDAFITRELYTKLKATRPYPKQGTILFSAGGTIGKSTVFTGKEAYFQDSNIVWLEHDNTVDAEFLRHFYRVAKWQDLNGSVTLHLSGKGIRETKFHRPCLKEQHKIASLITAVDAVVAACEQEVRAWHRTRQAIKHQLLSHHIRFHQPNGQPYPNWHTKSSCELCARMIGGDTPDSTNQSYYQGSIPWISISDLTKDDIYTVRYSKHITEEAIAHSFTKKVKAGSIALVLRVALGKVAILDRTTCTSDSFISLEEPTQDTAFLAYLLAERMEREKHYAEGSVQRSLRLSTFKALKHNIPTSKEEQHKIAACIDRLNAVVQTTQSECEAWHTLRRGLLQQLFP